ncbi:MAG: bifunctional diaminohydroxyphosphoribosylaminopyrimidine deaminase/5-amino-6-(5-phosphoribosylamino)uracil reductase RibD [Prevotella sp.]|nr:bifunctional diaminohydroxyphosphoribosylaminopyrimidine deaminase/5-amino-6-(5-phosphoribosylamino)uracil reductase RibD [Prevotella sp.]
MITSDDILLMHEAMMIAQQGEGRVNPNPLVGALVVVDDDVVASGYHHVYGDLHAERDAFRNADQQGIDCKGATMYVTLEPCCHYGKQPPCTEAIIEHGIKRGVVGLRDPNPLVAGKGIKMLQDAGIEVDVIDEKNTVKALREQNRVFLHYMEKRLPWVTAKWAMTLDGKIATSTGDSKWVSGEKAREFVHLMRSRNVGIMCGIGTVMADDPMLNIRLSDEALAERHLSKDTLRQPIRIVADHKARIPLDSNLVKSAKEQPLIIIHDDSAEADKLKQLEEAGVKLWCCADMKEAMTRAAAEKIDSILLEGGGILNEEMLKEGLVNEVVAFIAPKIVGGKEAKTPVEGDGFARMAEAVKLREMTIDKIGEDVVVTGLID